MNLRKLRKLKFSTIFIKLPKFPKFSNLFITFGKKMAYERSNSNKVTRRS